MDDWMHATDRHGLANVADLRGAGLGPEGRAWLWARPASSRRLTYGWYRLRSGRRRHGAAHPHDVEPCFGRTRVEPSRPSQRAAAPRPADPRRGPRRGPAVQAHARPDHAYAPQCASAAPSPRSSSQSETVTPGAWPPSSTDSPPDPLSALVAADGALRLGVGTRADLDAAVDARAWPPGFAGHRATCCATPTVATSHPGETRLGPRTAVARHRRHPAGAHSRQQRRRRLPAR